MHVALLFFLCLIISFNAMSESAVPVSESVHWNGPTSGPSAQPGKHVIFISQDSKNGGISTLFRHFQQASQILGWRIDYVDGRDDIVIIKKAFTAAVKSVADAVVVGGISSKSVEEEIKAVKKAGKVLVGWHATAEPGTTDELFVNIATPSLEVARLAAEYVIQNSQGPVGVVIFNDSRFEVANAKTQQMAEIISRCNRCRVLSIEDISLGETVSEVPKAVNRLLAEFGNSWTHSLGINDLYFDTITYPLRMRGRQDIQNISAGDGSFQALNRIRSGLSTQVATVAEPAGLQGWQLADELNRAFAGEPPSGFVSQPILVTSNTFKTASVYELDGNIPYKQRYQAIWFEFTPRTRPVPGKADHQP